MNTLTDKTGLKYRPNTSDLGVIREVAREYKTILDLCNNHTVMDIGANIGAFTFFALENGAKKVISYEPEPSNWEVLLNQNLNATLINSAISDKEGIINFYIGTSKNANMLCGTKPMRGRTKIEVSTLDFLTEIEKYKPTIIKCDCEGGEYAMDWENLPKYVEYVVLEIHNYGYEDKSPELLAWFENNFDILQENDITCFNKLYVNIRCGKRK